jgi:hypothetical protein
VERLTFSSDGKRLLAIFKVATGETFTSKVVIYLTERFPRGQLGGEVSERPTRDLGVIEWRWESDSPTGAAFSTDGKMATICTSRTQANAKIRLMKQVDGIWEYLEFQTVPVFSRHQSTWHGYGLTGIALYVSLNPQLTVASMTIEVLFYQSIRLSVVPLTAIGSVRQIGQHVSHLNHPSND